ncbi:hypothetical protein O9G_000405 [Rozella allomycis CSF55]|uniref:Uncharacterized protein n=1 Tax=Rozella allomycis (strain CSF55) TaxID=988480 RepID=A0A075AU21_ROZAC|nr:hypothetical protein O9G_000405 [Rozella allomycis CSF55]|eukprot:EPZ33630.1 hypothetical protein O9G_000405 [Rozella allomycis CSF55]
MSDIYPMMTSLFVAKNNLAPDYREGLSKVWTQTLDDGFESKRFNCKECKCTGTHTYDEVLNIYEDLPDRNPEIKRDLGKAASFITEHSRIQRKKSL